jgi:hypothetical protein
MPYDEDPLLRSARREATIALSVFVIALVYTIAYGTLFGYHHDGRSLRLVLGIPSWVFWGVFVPWGVCTVFSCWFSLYTMQDHVLEEPSLPPDAEGLTGEQGGGAPTKITNARQRPDSP